MATTTAHKELADNQDINTLAGKYLTFIIGHESYGVSVLRIREIIRLQEVTQIPQMPDYVKGVINLRGKIIPVVDLRIKFGMPNIQDGDSTCIIVMDVLSATDQFRQIGVVVDGVEEVVQIAANNIDPTPDFGMSSLDTHYILGMAKIKNVVKTLVDIDRAIGEHAIEHLAAAHSAVAPASVVEHEAAGKRA